MTDPQVVELEHGHITVLQGSDESPFWRVIPDAQWSLAETVDYLRAFALERWAAEVAFTFGDSAVEIGLDPDTDPLLVLHAYDLASRWGVPYRIDGKTNLQTLAEAVGSIDGGHEIVEAAAAAAATRAAESQRRYDQLAQRLDVVGAPEPQIAHAKEYSHYMARSNHRISKLLMQYLEKQMAAGVTLEQAAREGQLLLGLSKVNMTGVRVAVIDSWQLGREYEEVTSAR